MILSTPEPSPPVNVTATQTTCNSITVHWTPPADNGNAEITEYRVLVYNDSDTRVVVTNGTTMKLSYQVTSLEPKTDYTVEVQAGNDGGFGNGSRTNFTTGELTGYEVSYKVPDVMQERTLTKVCTTHVDTVSGMHTLSYNCLCPTTLTYQVLRHQSLCQWCNQQMLTSQSVAVVRCTVVR